MLSRAAPLLFVVIWSTGFIVARTVMPHASPEPVLLIRMALTALLMAGVALAGGARWPTGRRLGLHLVAGALLNGVYLCASWWAVEHGMPAGVMSLLGSSQPLVVAGLSFVLLRERLAAWAWLGLAVGIAGVTLVLAPLLGRGLSAPLSLGTVAVAVASILAMAAGTLIQRGALAQDGLAVSSAVQNAGGALVAVIATAATGERRWDNAPTLWLGLGWSVLMLSAGALSLLVWMTRRQSATRVSLLLLAAPPLAAIEAAVLFGERLTPVQVLGFGLAIGGVLLARARTPAPPLRPDP